VAPVLNELGRRIPGLTAILRTVVPGWFFDGLLEGPWQLHAVEQDIGCIQRGPLAIDYGETWHRHLRYQAEIAQREAEEVRAIRTARPSLVLSDISWLAIQAAALARVPAVGLCNLSWDRVLEPHVEQGQPDQAALVQAIRRAYGLADLMIRPMPGLAMPAFPKIADVGPLAAQPPAQPADLRGRLGAGEREPIVLVAFGGVALEALPFARMERMSGYRFLVAGPVPAGLTRVRSTDSVSLPFNTLMASADVIMTKPGYSTIVQAVAQDRPVLYVRRYNFADEESLVQYLHRYGRGFELSAEDFHAGRWEAGLQRLASVQPPGEPPPPPTGATEAADYLLRYF
jgi:hypothetical protein